MTSFFLIPIILAGLFFLSLTWFTLVTFAVCILSAWEWGTLTGLTSKRQYISLSILCGLLLIIIIPTVSPYKTFLTTQQAPYILWTALAWWIMTPLIILFYPRSVILWRKSRLFRLIFCILIILSFFYSMLILRQNHYNINHFTGSWWLLYVMILSWGLDFGAYVFGKTLGCHKLAPKISPQKTWEGLLGGLFTSGVIAYMFYKHAPIKAPPITLLICSTVTTLTSILGDLTESMFKREAKIKDSGYLIPGHGGILDRTDSLNAALPVFTCLMLLVFNAL